MKLFILTTLLLVAHRFYAGYEIGSGSASDDSNLAWFSREISDGHDPEFNYTSSDKQKKQHLASLAKARKTAFEIQKKFSNNNSMDPKKVLKGLCYSGLGLYAGHIIFTQGYVSNVNVLGYCCAGYLVLQGIVDSYDGLFYERFLKTRISNLDNVITKLEK